jgi:hypothetical protein
MMLRPLEFGPVHAETLGIAPGWWGVDELNTPVLGPFANEEMALAAIDARAGIPGAGGWFDAVKARLHLVVSTIGTVGAAAPPL